MPTYATITESYADKSTTLHLEAGGHKFHLVVRKVARVAELPRVDLFVDHGGEWKAVGVGYLPAKEVGYSQEDGPMFDREGCGLSGPLGATGTDETWNQFHELVAVRWNRVAPFYRNAK